MVAETGAICAWNRAELSFCITGVDGAMANTVRDPALGSTQSEYLGRTLCKASGQPCDGPEASAGLGWCSACTDHGLTPIGLSCSKVDRVQVQPNFGVILHVH